MREKMQRDHRNPKPLASAVAEALEPRRLLAGIEAGVLVAQGTGGADTISTRRSGIDNVIVTTNGVEQSFDMDDFTGVRLEGLGGNDTFNLIDPLTSPVVRNTTVLGGAGTDTVNYSARTAALDFDVLEEVPGTEPMTVMTSGAQTDLIDSNVEVFVGGSGADAFHYGGLLPETLEIDHLVFEGRGGNDSFVDAGDTDYDYTVHAGEGNDYIEIDEGNGKFLFAGSGDDRIVFDNTATPNSLTGGLGTDTIELGNFSGGATIDMRLFPDVENAKFVQFELIGNELANRLEARFDSEVTISGLGGDDTIIGSDSGDSLVGGYGDDSIDGGAGNDIADGGPGANTIVNVELQPPPGTIGIINGILIADGKWGQDLITIERIAGDNVIVRVNEVVREFDMDDFTGVLLRGNGGFDDIFVLDPIVAGSLVRNVTLEGGAGNDSLRGSSGTEVMGGGAGNDRIFGEGGTDQLFGGGGNDYLVGGPGVNDLLDGGDGHDYLDAVDTTGGETVAGGDGFDTAEIDPGDNASNVEVFA